MCRNRSGADLFRAKQYLDESERLVVRQKLLVSNLRKTGRPIQRAEAVLSSLESGCSQMRNYMMMLRELTWRQSL
jgi:hypothetical protein